MCPLSVFLLWIYYHFLNVLLLASIIDVINSAKKHQDMLKLVGEKVKTEQDVYRGFKYMPPPLPPRPPKKKKKPKTTN